MPQPPTNLRELRNYVRNLDLSPQRCKHNEDSAMRDILFFLLRYREQTFSFQELQEGLSDLGFTESQLRRAMADLRRIGLRQFVNPLWDLRRQRNTAS